MGLKEIRSIRQYTAFDDDGRMMKMYEVTFTTDKTKGEFTLDVAVDEYTAETVRLLAEAQATEIDAAIG